MIQEDGNAEDDPTLRLFLAFLAKEIGENPQRLVPFDEETMKRAAELTRGIEVNLDEALPKDFEF